MPKSSFTPPRGMRDIEPPEMAKRLWVNERILEVLRLYGFQVMEPTPLEDLHTLEAKSGPAIRQEIYWFKDKAGRNLGLRFDLTVGMARLVSNRYDLPEPTKLAAISGMWRYDEPQFARYRYFTQWDVEIFGSADPLADAEAIAVGCDILESVGLKDYVVRISNRRLTQAFLSKHGIRSPQKLEAAFRLIDKIRKAPRSTIARDLMKLGFSEKKVESILDFTSLSGTPDSVLSDLNSMNLEDLAWSQALAELAKLRDSLRWLRKLEKSVYDLSIVRGIGYYDGIVFEAFDKGGEDVGSIFGGGRYDKLCSLYGKRDLPATGHAGGIERLMISIERAKAYPELSLAGRVLVAPVNDSVRPNAVSLLSELRESGVPAEIDLKGRSLGKQLEYAESAGIPYVLILGPQEISRGIVKLRQMATRSEEELSVQQAVQKLRSSS